MNKYATTHFIFSFNEIEAWSLGPTVTISISEKKLNELNFEKKKMKTSLNSSLLSKGIRTRIRVRIRDAIQFKCIPYFSCF